MQFLFESADKGFGIFEAQLRADLRNRRFGTQEELLCPADAQGPFPVIEALSGTGFDQTGAMGNRKAEVIRYVIEGHLRQMILNIAQDLKILPPVGVGFGQGGLHHILVIAHDH